MKICICICLSEKNKKFSIKSLNSLNKLFIPDNCKLDIAFVLPNNFSYFKDFAIKKFKEKNIKLNFLTISQTGIPYARNKFLFFARLKKYAYLAFIDDDCEVDRNWLFEMLKLIKSEKVDIIGGPQNHNTTDSNTKNYFKLIEPEYKHKQKIKWAATNNVFFRNEILKDKNIKFDNKLDKIGGSDQLFFYNLWAKGYKLVWNKRAIVTENMHVNRKKINWFLKRNFRYGYSGHFIDICVHKLFLGKLISLIKIFIYGVMFFLSLLLIFTKNKKALPLFYLAKFSGRIYALVGFKIFKYY